MHAQGKGAANGAANGALPGKAAGPANVDACAGARQKGGVDLEAGVAAAVDGQQLQQPGMTLPFVQLTVTFRDIRYFVPMPGEVRPAPDLASPYLLDLILAALGPPIAPGLERGVILPHVPGRAVIYSGTMEACMHVSIHFVRMHVCMRLEKNLSCLIYAILTGHGRLRARAGAAEGGHRRLPPRRADLPHGRVRRGQDDLHGRPGRPQDQCASCLTGLRGVDQQCSLTVLRMPNGLAQW